MNNHTFKLSELDNEFWSKVIYIEKWRSSGVGGPGALLIVTTDKKLYFISFEAFPFSEHHLEAFSPIFKKKEPVNDYKHPYMCENEGWTYIVRGDILIRDDFKEAFYKARKEYEEKNAIVLKYILNISILAMAMEIDEFERFDEEEFSKLREKYKI